MAEVAHAWSLGDLGSVWGGGAVGPAGSRAASSAGVPAFVQKREDETSAPIALVKRAPSGALAATGASSVSAGMWDGDGPAV